MDDFGLLAWDFKGVLALIAMLGETFLTFYFFYCFGGEWKVSETWLIEGEKVILLEIKVPPNISSIFWDSSGSTFYEVYLSGLW